MAYYSRSMSLKDITDHIYGRANMVDRNDCPNMFIKELEVYLSFLQDKIKATISPASPKQVLYLTNFVKDIEEGIQYYANLFNNHYSEFREIRFKILMNLDDCSKSLNKLMEEIESLSEHEQYAF